MDLQAHPEVAENLRHGAEIFSGVQAEYAIENGELIGRGALEHWYAPFAHAELPGELAKLHAADDAQIVDFATVYGELGYGSLAAREGLDWHPGIGDPVDWIRAHAFGLHVCLSLSDAIRRKLPSSRLGRMLEGLNGRSYGVGAITRRLDIDRTAQKPVMQARIFRAKIVNENVRRVFRYLAVDERGRDRTYFRFVAPVDVPYWHLANLVDGGIVKRCEAQRCGAFFIQTDPRQRFCPKRWRQRESACATRHRQRVKRGGQHG